MDAYAPPQPVESSADVTSARTAAILGVLSMAFGMSACCTSVMGVGLSTLLGGVALFLSKALLDQQPTGEARAYANVGFYTGVLSLVWGLVVGLAIFAYMMLYVVIIVGAVVAG